MRKIRWGILSTARIAHQFAEDLAYVDNASLTAVASRAGHTATEFAARHGIATAYSSYEQLYEAPDIDAVYIATPHSLHRQNATDALRAGKAVLCEKPLTTSADECRRLLDAASRSGVYLMEGMWTWFLPAVRRAKAWFDAGRIGKMRHIRADFGYPKAFDPDSRLYDPVLAGGCLLDMGIYPIAIARLFAGRAPDDVQATVRRARSGVDDDVVMTFVYPDCTAALATSFRCKLPNTAWIVGTEGYIEIPHFWSARDCRLVVMHDVVDAFTDEREGSGFEFQIEAVSADVIEGRTQSAVVTHADSLAFASDMDRVMALASA